MTAVNRRRFFKNALNYWCVSKTSIWWWKKINVTTLWLWALLITTLIKKVYVLLNKYLPSSSVLHFNFMLNWYSLYMYFFLHISVEMLLKINDRTISSNNLRRFIIDLQPFADKIFINFLHWTWSFYIILFNMSDSQC